MIAATSTHMAIANRITDANKCPLKVSLVGVPQKMLIEIKDTGESVIKTLISDYIKVDPENNLPSLKRKRSDENVKPEDTNPTTDDDIEDCQSNSDNSIHTDQKSETNDATKDCNKKIIFVQLELHAVIKKQL
ncbi:4443_t:CDS:2, partial [Dentiscutata erythropus]